VERWRRIARESAQQARLLAPPEVADAIRWDAALALHADARYFLDEGVAAPLAASIPSGFPPGGEAALLVGPEGGWTPGERERAAAAGWAAASLGPQILRAETAAVAGLAVLLNALLR
jgi:16S rRNA (uracil1498-N3)-methyltransferase